MSGVIAMAGLLSFGTREKGDLIRPPFFPAYRDLEGAASILGTAAAPCSGHVRLSAAIVPVAALGADALFEPVDAELEVRQLAAIEAVAAGTLQVRADHTGAAAKAGGLAARNGATPGRAGDTKVDLLELAQQVVHSR